LEIAKDSSNTPYTQTDNSSPTTKEAVNAWTISLVKTDSFGG
jgi:hypothetical protein